MNLNQTKLTKTEWDSIEIPVSPQELVILKMISAGGELGPVPGGSGACTNTNPLDICKNSTLTFSSYFKLDCSPAMEEYMYDAYIVPMIRRTDIEIDVSRYSALFKPLGAGIIRLKSADQIRLNHANNACISIHNTDIYECVLAALLVGLVANLPPTYLDSMPHSVPRTTSTPSDLAGSGGGSGGGGTIVRQHSSLHSQTAQATRTPAPTNGNNSTNRLYHYYTLVQLRRNTVCRDTNPRLIALVDAVLADYAGITESAANPPLAPIVPLTIEEAVAHAPLLIEQNPSLFKYSDMKLYAHQKRAIALLNQHPEPKLVFYTAATGTGKTVTPIAIVSGSRRVIFVCAARHVGIALARAAISVDKKVAFAFGCSCAEDVRLHYAAAAVYTRDRRSGGIRKVDNTVGHLVQLMICDVGSYLYAMYYMMSFNDPCNIVTFWDEPTISLDCETSPLHEMIRRNWAENLIPNIYLSSFTLPDARDLPDVTANFLRKFPTGDIHTIQHDDSLKSIPLITPDGYVAMPHLMARTFSELLVIIARIEHAQTLLRYIDLQSAVDVIRYISDHQLAPASDIDLARAFNSIGDISMTSIKRHYLRALRCLTVTDEERIQHLNAENNVGVDVSVDAPVPRLCPASWVQLRDHFHSIRVPRIPTPIPGTCGVFVTTSDAHTLTDGPTLFLATDIKKIALFCIQQCNIPAAMMTYIQTNINHNDQIAAEMDIWERKLQDLTEQSQNQTQSSGGGSASAASGGFSKRMNKMAGAQETAQNHAVKECYEHIDAGKRAIKSVKVDDIFIPNTIDHIKKWTSVANANRAILATNANGGQIGAVGSKPFVSRIDEATVVSVMQLPNVESYLKVLLLIGIGVLMPHESAAYTEIVKRLADSQQLYLNLASGDYIYGTNYQHCHGYIGRDTHFSQEKLLQAVGRIGRFNMQQQYTIRFRDETSIYRLFETIPPEDKMEVTLMNRLFGDNE